MEVPTTSPAKAMLPRESILKDGSASKKLIKDQLNVTEIRLPNGDIKKEVRAQKSVFWGGVAGASVTGGANGAR
jgi:hypothetical protein